MSEPGTRVNVKTQNGGYVASLEAQGDWGRVSFTRGVHPDLDVLQKDVEKALTEYEGRGYDLAALRTEWKAALADART